MLARFTRCCFVARKSRKVVHAVWIAGHAKRGVGNSGIVFNEVMLWWRSYKMYCCLGTFLEEVLVQSFIIGLMLL